MIRSVLLLLALCMSVHAKLALLPEKVSLTGDKARQQLLAVDLREGASVGLVGSVRYSSSNPEVATVSKTGQITPRADGTATITAMQGERTANAKVAVSGVGKNWQWSFRNHVLPVFSKQGCNSGGCHGALAGKGGFRLSLNGYDPPSDHHNITRAARGRRIEKAAPGRSLLLTKPTTAVKHKGGRRLSPGSRDYDILAQWIIGGAKAPKDGDAKLARLEVFPERIVLKPGEKHPLSVRAIYTDGTEEDVTPWSRFSATDATVAEVDKKTGEISVVGHGEGAITVWFSSQIVIARVTAPYENRIPQSVFANAEHANFIDDLVLAQLQRLNLKPSPRAKDEEFLRRVYLDTIGTMPRPKETRAFLADKTAGKRERLIDALLARNEYVDYWTYRWADVFLINGRLLRPDAVKSYYDWIRKQVENNTPWDQIARQVVTAKGESTNDGEVNFYSVHQEPEAMAENVSQAFLSLSIGCAKCHNHPLEKWTNDQYYSFANLFARVRAKGWGGDARSGDGKRTLYVMAKGDLIQPRTGKPQPPAPLDGKPIPVESTEDRREFLADWLTSPDNPYFTKAVANRVWAAFFGIGLVNSVDDMRVSNPPSNPKLMDTLAEFLVEQHYDLKALMRVILQSETYQRTSVALAENKDDQKHFSRYYPRRLMAEVLHDAIAGITDVPTVFDKLVLTDGSTQDTKAYPKGTRALQLADSSVGSYFLKTFGRNERAITCECERSETPSMVQVLHLSNGSTLNEKLKSKECSVTGLVGTEKNTARLIDEVYLRCLARFPTKREKDGLIGVFNETPENEQRQAVEDLFWALMTSREFLFQH
ncbi:MAG: S-layer protein [Verrucomicrobiales bacterium]|nr:S-layer protein [Verrucomicrobiales bacterium]